MASLIGTILNRAPVDITESRRYGFRTGVTAPKGGTAAALSAMEAQATVFSIVDGIASEVAKTEWRMYAKPAGAPPRPHRLKPTDEGERTQRHPALTVWNKPNPFYTRPEFVEATIQHFELVGEMPWLVGRSGRAQNGPPIELWPIRPDRIKPVASPSEFISGWMYLHGDGLKETPLRLDQVLFTKRPHPTNPYRGIGPIQSLLWDLEGEKAAAEFNTAFFRNGAEPGGIIKTEHYLTDEEFNQLVERWSQQHRGVGNAHRVGVLEGGVDWIERRFSARDMQFEQLRRYSRETIRGAWRYPKPMLGDVEDVNRANAEAADVVFAKYIARSRLNRIRDTLNYDFLPLFGAMGDRVEFDYVDPVPPDQAEERLDLKNRVELAIALVEARFDKSEVLPWLQLPDWDREDPAPIPAALGAPDGDGDSFGE